MKRITTILPTLRLPKKSHGLLLAATLLAGSVLITGVAQAASSMAGSSAGTNTAANQQQRLQTIISKGNQEIERRLTTLSALNTKITAAAHLTASDKAALSSEVSSTVSGLTTLKATLDADTTVAGAHTDAESIYTEYRVYAIVAPKVNLIKVADDQQVVQAKLSAFATKLQGRITAAQQAGKNVTTLQSELTDMNSQIVAASKIATTMESTVIGLQPSDYNSNHAVLSGDNAQLKTAHADDQTALTDAKNIVSTLKSL